MDPTCLLGARVSITTYGKLLSLGICISYLFTWDSGAQAALEIPGLDDRARHDFKCCLLNGAHANLRVGRARKQSTPFHTT